MIDQKLSRQAAALRIICVRPTPCWVQPAKGMLLNTDLVLLMLFKNGSNVTSAIHNMTHMAKHN